MLPSSAKAVLYTWASITASARIKASAAEEIANAVKAEWMMWIFKIRGQKLEGKGKKWEVGNKKWEIDVTGNWVGKKRLPSTASNPVEFQRGNESVDYWVLHSQVSYNFKNFTFYITLYRKIWFI